MKIKNIFKKLVATTFALALLIALIPVQPVQAAFSGLNGRITFVSGRDGNTEIYFMSANGATQTNLTNNIAVDVDQSWSPDGTKIAFDSVTEAVTAKGYS